MSDTRAQYLGNGTDRGWPEKTSGPERQKFIASSPDIHRVLPHSVEAEQGVLGSMIIGGRDVVDECRAKLPDPAAFYIPAHQTIFGCLLKAHEAGAPTDLITVTQDLRDLNELDRVGGAPFVTSLFTFVPTAANVAYYLEIVREKWVLRGLIANCTETARRAYEEQDDVELLLNDHVSNAIEIGQSTSIVESIKHLAEFVPGAVEEIEATYHNRGKPLGLASGFYDLDRMTNGFQAPLTYYVAGRPAMGKSSAMLEIADHIAIANAADGVNIGIFSTEMTGRHLAEQLLCARGDIDLQRLRDGFLKKDTLDRLHDEAARLVQSHVWIDDKAALSIFEFRARARRMVVKMKVKLILIDYIQRMHSTSRRAQGNREQEMNEIAQGISATAKELNVPIVVLAQLNRNPEDRPDKRPGLSDLRESGSMEQEARVVVLLYRPTYYVSPTDDAKRKKMARSVKIEVPEDDDEANDPAAPWRIEFDQYAELIVAKQNRGPVGTVKVRFVKEFARFENVTKKLYSNDPGQRQQNLEDDF